MFIRSLLLAAVAATSIGAHATLAVTTNSLWPPAGSTGLGGVLFNEQVAGEVVVALGAHAYFNGPINVAGDGSNHPAPNTFDNSSNTFTASPGLYTGGAAGSNPAYANWSFDFYYNLGVCTTCTVELAIDATSKAGNSLVHGFLTGPSGSNSLNIKMAFLNEMAFLNIPFDAFSTSQTDFTLTARDAAGLQLAKSNISVAVFAAPPSTNIPEPGSLALVGLALAGMGALRRRKG